MKAGVRVCVVCVCRCACERVCVCVCADKRAAEHLDAGDSSAHTRYEPN